MPLLPALLLGGEIGPAPARASAAAPEVVLVVPTEGMIDLGTVPFVERALKDAADQSASLVLLDIDTLGGRLDAAVAIRDRLLESAVPTAAFVNPRAISAGALIALATQRIVVARGATIGAATPVVAGPSGGAPEVASEKTLSYVRKEFRATADARGRPGSMAEAMVDPDVAIAGVIESGKLLTLTADEALAHGMADARAENVSGAIAALGREGAQVHFTHMNWAEHAVRFLTRPLIASILMTFGMVGLVVELRTPGFGVPGLVGVASFIAFFWGHGLVHLVGWEQIALIGAGVLLLAVELFVIPGFGAAGVLGILALALGLGTSLIGEGASLAATVNAITRVAVSAVLALLLSLAAFLYLPRLPGGQKLVLGGALAARSPRSAEPATADREALVGANGTALTPLRPAGIAAIGGQRIDVVSGGEFIAAGAAVEVVRDEGLRVVVQKQRVATEKEGPA